MYVHVRAHMWKAEVNIGCCSPRSCPPWVPSVLRFVIVCARVLYARVCEIAGALGGQKRASDPLDLEFISGCELLMWIPGIELWFSLTD